MTEALLAVPSGHTLETDILDHINEHHVISLDVLTVLMPQYSWNQIFLTVDRLAREGKLVLRRHQFTYTLFSTQYPA